MEVKTVDRAGRATGRARRHGCAVPRPPAQAALAIVSSQWWMADARQPMQRALILAGFGKRPALIMR